MEAFNILAVLITLAALFGWINHRFIRLPAAIGLMTIALVFSFAIVAIGRTGSMIGSPLLATLRSVNFDATLLRGMLGALLFAAALHMNINDLLKQRWVIAALATFGVLLSTVIIGVAAHGLFGLLGVGIPLAYAFLFGALISPTDPIAVGAILRKAWVPHSLQTKIEGESLFNDGVGVVLFAAILGVAGGEHAASWTAVAHLFAVEAVGGVAYGALLGWVAYRMLKSVDNYQVEILLTLAVVTGGYALAQELHTSGPLAMVVAGLFIGNQGRALAMSEHTRARLDSFWELVDEFLNALLFVMIGFEALVLDLSRASLLAGLIAVPLVLLARWVSVSLPLLALRWKRSFSPHAIKLLTWGGLRGGISVALALSIPQGPERDLLVTVTYVVVSFSIIVKGLSIGALTRRLYPAPSAD